MNNEKNDQEKIPAIINKGIDPNEKT